MYFFFQLSFSPRRDVYVVFIEELCLLIMLAAVNVKVFPIFTAEGAEVTSVCLCAEQRHLLVR
jgi:hypothetical protein